MSIAARSSLLGLQLPMGRLADRVGAKPLWAVASAVEAALYFAWPLIGGMVTLRPDALGAGGLRDRRPQRPQASTGSRSSRARSGCGRWPTCGRPATSATRSAPARAGSRSGSGLGAVKLIPLVTGGLLVLNALMIAIVLPVIARPGCRSSQRSAIDHGGSAGLAQLGFVMLGDLQRRAHLQPGAAQRRRAAVAGRAHRRPAHPAGLALRHQHGAGGAPAGPRVAGWPTPSTAPCGRCAGRAGAFIVSCALIAVTHETVGWLSIVLIWLGHITITGAELWQSAADWCFTVRALRPPPPRRLPGRVGHRPPDRADRLPRALHLPCAAGRAPGLGRDRAIGVTAAVVAHPAARAAERHLVRIGAPVGV